MDKPGDMIPPGWGKDKVTEYYEIMRKNCFATFHNQKTLFNRIVGINDAFNKINEYMKKPKLDEGLALIFFLKAQASYLTASQLASGGQVSETFMVLRGALESALYGFYIFKNPKQISIWLKRHENQESMQKVKDTFKISNLLNVLKQTNQNLYKQTQTLYNQSIDYGAHPNEKYLSSVLHVIELEQSTQYNIDYLVGDPKLIAFCIKNTAQTGIVCLKMLQLIVPDKFKLSLLDVKLDKLSVGL
jgi:hypothetical protein